MRIARTSAAATRLAVRNQHTIASTCEVGGRGYWGGRQVTVRMHPAPVDTGIVFCRTDLADHPTAVANTSTVSAISFRSNLKIADAKVCMIEHLMAALSGLEIDNCLVEIDGEELPGLDGSSLAYVEALQPAGLIIQAAAKPRVVIDQVIRVRRDDTWIEARPNGRPTATYEYRLDYGTRSPIPTANYSIDLTPHRFVQQIASARTFVTADQAASLQASGLATHVTTSDLIVFDESGPVDTRLRFPDECARHKTLDMIGDLALAGVDLIGHIVSNKGGHVLNGLLARQIAERVAEMNLVQRKSRHAA